MCKPNYPVAKFGEEDLRICEEECFESYFLRLKEGYRGLLEVYEDQFFEDFEDKVQL